MLHIMIKFIWFLFLFNYSYLSYRMLQHSKWIAPYAKGSVIIINYFNTLNRVIFSRVLEWVNWQYERHKVSLALQSVVIRQTMLSQKTWKVKVNISFALKKFPVLELWILLSTTAFNEINNPLQQDDSYA